MSSTIGNLDPADYHKAIQGVASALAKMLDPGFAAVSKPGGLSIDQLFDVPTLFIVGTRLSQGDTGKIASSLLLNMTVQRIYQRFGKPGRPLLFALDEAPRIVDRFAFEEVLSMGRGARVTIVLAAQDVSQFKDENDRSAILGNCATAVVFPGASKATREWLQSRLGTYQENFLTQSVQSGGLSLSTTAQAVPVLDAREMFSVPFGRRPAILHISSIGSGTTSKPLIIDLER